MKTALYSYHSGRFFPHAANQPVNEKKVNLVLCFGSRPLLARTEIDALIRQKFPDAEIVSCSTSGEIFHTEIMEETISITAIEFASTRIRTHILNLFDYSDSAAAGRALVNELKEKELSYILVLSDGNLVNGSELVRGMNEVAGNRVLITGGLAGDDNRFEHTLVGLNGTCQEGMIAGIGFYGTQLEVNHGSLGGWEGFGLEKKVTRSRHNKLYEIENFSALELYKQYLGPDAETLPGSALLFPLLVRLPGSEEPVVRTILSIDNDEGSMTFAGDIPVGSTVRFMKANFDKLTRAASGAASMACPESGNRPELALVISCVGRKLILKSRTPEEVEAVNKVFGPDTLLTGFYSYGEISPNGRKGRSELHNQTMTITTFHEISTIHD